MRTTFRQSTARCAGHLGPTMSRCHPDAVRLSPEAEAAAVLKCVEDGPGCSVKDSFAVLDLVPSGFHVVFEATWIRGPALPEPGRRPRTTGAACRCRRISNSGARVAGSMSPSCLAGQRRCSDSATCFSTCGAHPLGHREAIADRPVMHEGCWIVWPATSQRLTGLLWPA